MSDNTQIEERKAQVARPLKVLIPLIKEEIQLGDDAGLVHYIRAGGMLLEAKTQMPHGKFNYWSTTTFKRTKATLAVWMKLATKSSAGITFETLSELRGDMRKPGRPPVWHEPIKKIFHKIDIERGQRFLKHFESQAKEEKLVRELARQLIDAGYKVLAIKLHPDKGGSQEGMQRLNEAKKLLLKYV